MRGTIKIIANGEGTINFDMRMKGISRSDKGIIFDCLARALDLDEIDRQVISYVIGKGGLGVLTGVAPTEVRIDTEALGKFGNNLD